MEGSRATALALYADDTAGCTDCPLAATRSHVVFGAGDPDADLVLVGEAPGFHEDRLGTPFVGQAGRLLDRLLASIGLERSQVYLANVLMCRPPGNRDPLAEEIAACERHLFRQLELVRPNVVAPLGNTATKLLSGRPLGITVVHGQPQELSLGGRQVTLYPLFHPAAALYTPLMLRVLEQDFLCLPGLFESARETLEDPGAHRDEPALATAVGHPVQLGLFD
jgi:DNA polymerase